MHAKVCIKNNNVVIVQVDFGKTGTSTDGYVGLKFLLLVKLQIWQETKMIESHNHEHCIN